MRRVAGSVRDGVTTTPFVGLALIVVLSALAVAAVPIWILHDFKPQGEKAEAEAFVSTPQFVLWLLILAGQAAIWVAAGFLVLRTVCRRIRYLRRRRALPAASVVAIVASAVVLGLVVGFLNFGPRIGFHPEVASSRLSIGDLPLSGHERKMPILAGTAFLIGLVAIAGMWLTAVAFQHHARRSTPRRLWVKRFIELREELTTLLAVAGVLIGLAMLSSGALREAVLAANFEPAYRDKVLNCLELDLSGSSSVSDTTRATVRTDLDSLLETNPHCLQLQFDRRYVLAYGLLFTGALGIAFAPSFVAMRRAGARLRDLTYPLPKPRQDDQKLSDALAERKAFDDLLETSLRGSAAFKAGAAILTPLAASLISTLIPT
jgi:hypothetical protein